MRLYTDNIPGCPYISAEGFTKNKLKKSLVEWIEYTGCSFLFELGTEVMNLNSNSIPDYSRMRFMLIKNLLDKNIVPERQIKINHPSEFI